MTWPIIIAVILNIIHAFIDAYRISDKMSKDGKDINHFPGAAIYSVLCVVVAYLFGNVYYAIPMILLRPVIFDPVLNVVRVPSKNPFYVSPRPTSVVDKIEKKLLGKDGRVHWIAWIGLTVFSIILVYNYT